MRVANNRNTNSDTQFGSPSRIGTGWGGRAHANDTTFKDFSTYARIFTVKQIKVPETADQMTPPTDVTKCANGRLVREGERCRRGGSRATPGDTSGRQTLVVAVRGGRVRAAGGESAGCAAGKRTSGWEKWKAGRADVQKRERTSTIKSLWWVQCDDNWRSSSIDLFTSGNNGLRERPRSPRVRNSACRMIFSAREDE
jgi:hypothetical protein